MNQAKAELNNYRQSPRKVRRVADAIRGKRIAEARTILQFMTKRPTGPIAKLLNSAVANSNAKPENLFVKAVSVNAGKIMYRQMPAAHGAAHPIRKRTSHVAIVLEEKEPAVKKVKKPKK